MEDPSTSELPLLPKPPTHAGRLQSHSHAQYSPSSSTFPPSAHACAMRASRQRQHFIDRLRVLLTFLVLVHHVFYIYWLGWWPYYGQWLPDSGEAIAVPSWTFMAGNQAYFMGLFFFLSGTFSAPSLQRKGARAFLVDRALRLLVPAVIFELLLAPLTCYISQGVNSFDAPMGLASAPSAFIWYFKQYHGFGANPAWFLFLLMMFDCAHACWPGARLLDRCHGSPCSLLATSYTTVKTAEEEEESSIHDSRQSSDSAPILQPYTLVGTLSGMALLAACLAASCYLVRIVSPIGAWLPAVFVGLQPAYLPQYVGAYALGVAAHRSDALSRLPCCEGFFGPVLLLAALTWFTVGWAAVLSAAGANAAADMPNPAAPLLGGLTLQSLFYSTFEQSFAVLWSTGLLVTGRDRFNSASGLLESRVIGAAYCTYLIHPLVVYSLTRLLTAAAVWPVTKDNILMHVLAECPLVVVGTWLLAMAVKAMPGVGRVL